MSLYKITPDKLERVSDTTFANEKLLERKDIQRLLRKDIRPLGEDLMVIAEEYGKWEDSSRRIDLLCLSEDASLVVVEIKRTEDGGHMELQALRYAAMVSSMTLDQVVRAYAETKGGEEDEARQEILDFLDLESEDEKELSGEVKIILVSANFSTELTTAVLWLNRHDLDITCIRIRPYKNGSDVLIDVTQIIPLPETADYEIRIREQEREKRKVLSAREEIFRRFWQAYVQRAQKYTDLLSGRTGTKDHWLGAAVGRSGFQINSVVTQEESQIECYIRLATETRSKAAFHELMEQKKDIEKAFGAPLVWEERSGRKGCRIYIRFPGGWRSSETEWPEIQARMLDALARMEKAMKDRILELRA